MGKKIGAVLVIALLCIGIGLACLSAGTDSKEDGENGDRLQVVCTVFPAYDWVCRIAGEKVEPVYLMDTGVDLHSYQPSAADFVAIAECDIVIYVGGQSEAWMQAALDNSVNEDLQILNMMELLGDTVKEETLTEGMQEEQHWFRTEEETEYDEHVWLSLRNAEVICNAITKALVRADKENAAYYENRNQEYQQELAKLDKAYADMVAKAATRTLLFGDRFPFRYLTEDYGLEYYAAFPGCSAETKASFETITFLAEKLESCQFTGVLILEDSSPEIAQAIIANTKDKDQSIFVLDSLQSVDRTKIEEGVTYLSVMENNRIVFGQALGMEEEANGID